jgi:hypothetical protein
VSFEQMQLILAKHGGKRVKPLPVEPLPTPEPAFVPRLSDEIWLAEKLKKAGAPWKITTEGLTSSDVRRERVRAVILGTKLEAQQCGKREGKPVTFGECFEIVYAQPLSRSGFHG